MYGEIASVIDTPSINQTNDGAKTLTAAGLDEGRCSCMCCHYRQANQRKRQEQKGSNCTEQSVKDLAAADTNAPYYRALNTLNKNRLPNPYEAQLIQADDDDNALQVAC